MAFSYWLAIQSKAKVELHNLFIYLSTLKIDAFPSLSVPFKLSGTLNRCTRHFRLKETENCQPKSSLSGWNWVEVCCGHLFLPGHSSLSPSNYPKLRGMTKALSTT